jgi:hypothetical protein
MHRDKGRVEESLRRPKRAVLVRISTAALITAWHGPFPTAADGADVVRLMRYMSDEQRSADLRTVQNGGNGR